MWRSIASRSSLINRSFTRKLLFCLENPSSEVIHKSMISSSYYHSFFSSRQHPPKNCPHQNQRFMSNSSCNYDGNNKRSDAQIVGSSSNYQKFESIEGVDEEKLEKVLSLLVNGFVEYSLESHDTLDLLLNFEFFWLLLQNPPKEIPDEHLIWYFKWVLYKYDDFKVTKLILSEIVPVITLPRWFLCPSRKKFLDAIWNLVKEIGEKESGFVTTQILNCFLFAFSLYCNGEAAIQILDKFEEFGCVPNVNSYLYTAYHGTEDSDEPWELEVCQRIVDDGILGKTVGAESVVSLIGWYCQIRKPKLAHVIYVAAEEKIPQESVHYLIRCLSKRDETLCLAMDMLADLSCEARKNGTVVFSCVVSGLCRKGDMEGAKKLFGDMIVKGPPPGARAFNDIIKSLCVNGELEDALEMLKLMECRGLKPNVGSYHLIIKGYKKRGMMEQASEVFSMAKNKHPNSPQITSCRWFEGFATM